MAWTDSPLASFRKALPPASRTLTLGLSSFVMVLLFDTANAFCGMHTEPVGGCFFLGIYRMLLDSVLYAWRWPRNNGGASKNRESLQRERTSYFLERRYSERIVALLKRGIK